MLADAQLAFARNDSRRIKMATTRRQFLQQAAVGAGSVALAAFPMQASLLKKGGVILSCETYSLRDMNRGGRLSLEAIPALYKELGIEGISWNDMFFKSWETSYLDSLKNAAKEA